MRVLQTAIGLYWMITCQTVVTRYFPTITKSLISIIVYQICKTSITSRAILI
jgi:hypothetical protein